MLRRKYARIRAAAAIMLFFADYGIAAAGDRLNVIIVSLDLLRTDRLAAYGSAENLAPNLAAFAGRSVVFRNAISPSSWTLPAAMSVFTGLYATQHKITNTVRKNDQGGMESNSLAPGILTLPGVFKNQGYETGAFTSGGAFFGKYGFSRGFDWYKDADAVKINESFSYAKEWLKTRSGKGPFFMLIQGFDLLYLINANAQIINRKTAEGIPSLYNKGVTAADSAFGDFFSFLERKGLLKNTVIAFLSHHGEGFDEHPGRTHGTALYEELIHVPLMIYRPGTTGTVIGVQVSLLDLGPTLIAAAGLKEDEKYAAQSRGIALYPFAGKKNKCRNIFSETESLFLVQKSAIRTCAGWKLIYDSRNSARELYDLNADPGERKDLFEGEPEIAWRLENELLKWMAE